MREFIHNFLPKLDVRQQLINGKRHYHTPEGKFYPSVTTVLSAMTDKSAIVKWKKRVGVEEANRIKNRSAARGTKLHTLVEKMLLNETIDFSGVMPTSRMLFEQLRPILTERIGTIYGIELPVYSDRLKTAGRVDLIADFDGIPSLIDIKSSIRSKKREWAKSYFLQETVYSCCLLERFDFKCKRIVTLVAVEEDFSQVFVEKTADYIAEVLAMFREYHSQFPG
jgi:hypothetical protein